MGIRSCKRSRTADDRGALPTVHSCTESSAAVSKRGCSSTKVAMAGTKNTDTGRSASTASSQWSASNLGMYTTLMPNFIGV